MPSREDNGANTLTLNNLRKYIVEHKLKPGDHIPPEREMAEELGITRHALRDALKSFEVIGLLSRRPKHGTVIRKVDLRQVAQLTRFAMVRNDKDMLELFTARLMLELSILPLVIMNAEEKDYAKMEDICLRMEEDIAAGGSGKDADEDFHQAFIMACHNRFITQYSALIHEYFQGYVDRISTDRDRLAMAAEEHRRLIEYLKGGDAERAQSLLKGHLWRIVSYMALDESALPAEWKPA